MTNGDAHENRALEAEVEAAGVALGLRLDPRVLRVQACAAAHAHAIRGALLQVAPVDLGLPVGQEAVAVAKPGAHGN